METSSNKKLQSNHREPNWRPIGRVHSGTVGGPVLYFTPGDDGEQGQ